MVGREPRPSTFLTGAPMASDTRYEWQFEWGKLGLCVILLLGGFGLMFTGDKTEGIAIIGTVTGYIFGNGRLASKGQQSVPAIRVRDSTDTPPPSP